MGIADVGLPCDQGGRPVLSLTTAGKHPVRDTTPPGEPRQEVVPDVVELEVAVPA